MKRTHAKDSSNLQNGKEMNRCNIQRIAINKLENLDNYFHIPLDWIMLET